MTELPLKDLFKEWMIEEETGISPASAVSYCSYTSSACKDLKVKYNGQIMYVFDAIQMFINQKDIDTFQDFMDKIIHLYYSEDFLKIVDRPKSTISNWRTGLNRYLEFVYQYLDPETEDLNIHKNSISIENEGPENIIKITKDELYSKFHFRLITQDRYYENILYPIGLIKRLFYKTGRKEIFNKYIKAMIDKTLVYSEDGILSIADINSFLIDPNNEEVHVLTNENKKLQVFTPTHEKENVLFKVKSFLQISLDHIVPMHDIMVQNQDKLSEICKLTNEIKKRMKGKISNKIMRATYSPIIEEASDLEQLVNFSTMEKELVFLCEKTKLQLMDSRENSRKGKR
ncbi:hypothetical protein [Dysgonomonas sp. 520]|uniref:hypothetical protein n=1 Tax=Dysgonomonas sp. 520 TaxID=2302931 RepID=UPI0013D4D02B|nr:hypothetical protein [Dysgonomonas sp. 520]NDW08657.1 hypothetical protein [Dysgonomonas sp. 520]